MPPRLCAPQLNATGRRGSLTPITLVRLDEELHPTEKFLVSVKQGNRNHQQLRMKVCLPLICLLFLTALMDGDAVKTVRRKEGQNIKFGFKAMFAGKSKYFCTENCKKKILVKTTGDIAHSGRYSIEYQSFADGTAVLNVSISKLKQSDTGWYRGALYRPDGPLQYSDFRLIVTGAKDSSVPNSTLETFTFLLSTPAPTTAAEKQKLSPFILPTIQKNRAVKLTDETVVLIYVGACVAFLSIMYQIALKFYRWKRSEQQNDSTEESESDDVSPINPEREETKEDRQNNEEISLV